MRAITEAPILGAWLNKGKLVELQNFDCELSIVTANDFHVGVECCFYHTDIWRPILSTSLICRVKKFP